LDLPVGDGFGFQNYRRATANLNIVCSDIGAVYAAAVLTAAHERIRYER